MQRGEGDVIGMILFGGVMTLIVLVALVGAVADALTRFFA